ncbi:4a-hydroxytetrahydrobiopterin dehydratase [Amycolatopsis rubida]|uniref:Putative pterin-4-alpha-carbinolamine dehydratase n=1 Tax=Amycolatopsis rubida TaxID=112413 RepID=A0ABX0BTM9_9PSEU|nr:MULTISPECIES: 4a-hydroxytetrahydrobiopterin dehydratase [Amycolatopsis]MYW93311.1 4a-hydroxytetrahydrobiopterin dehydratase [Amycolatopsis rubida]NEC58298.1 4a-hydroxytetrahydrobiopterin dehydratase [Amycolatopsis rubida]OAP28706.1 putative pterin-4-alpha-carbinolamine dehydratase [Amycolatopsis sp. M39]
MTQLLNDSAVEQALGSVPEWRREDDSIARTVELLSFPAAIEVVDRVAELAEEADHHPDIDIRWRTLTFRLSTHYLGGLTERDFALARQIDEVLAAR